MIRRQALPSFARPLAGAVPLLALLLLAGCGEPGGPAEPAPPAPVVTAVVERADFTPALTLLGEVEAAATAEVVAAVPGRLRYPPRFAAGLPTGERVAAGELLARVEDAEVELALAEARLARRSAEGELERQRRAFEAGVVPEARLDAARAEAELAALRLEGAEERARRLAIRASAAGLLVVARPRPPGAPVAAGEALAEIALDGPARVVAAAPAAERHSLRPGLTAELRPPGGGPAVAAELAEVDPVVGPGGALRLVLAARAGVPAAPGEGVEVRVLFDTRRQALTVPAAALAVGGGGSAVFVVERRFDHLQAVRRPVTLGARGDGLVEVLEGLAGGERVVVEGASLLADGAMVVDVGAGGDDAGEGE